MPDSANTPVDTVLRSALTEARRALRPGDGLVHAIVARTGFEQSVLLARSQQLFGVTGFERRSLEVLDPDFSSLSVTDCNARFIFPARTASGTIFIVDDPWHEGQRQWLISRLGNTPVLGWADRGDIAAALAAAQLRVTASRHGAARGADLAGDDAEADPSVTHTISLETIEASQSGIVRFVDAAIYDAWKSGASDIHFECGRSGMRVMLRLDGVLVEAARLETDRAPEEAISRIKVLAQLDITERRVPQDGRFRVRLGGRDIDFRVSIMPSIHGEDAVLRLLDKTQLRAANSTIALETLGFDALCLERIRRLARRPHGMLLVTGPTGSGKTTTLYATITEIQTGQDKIITIEDPVEYELEGVLQIPVNEKKGLTFARGLRSILRHDPDKILVGEIRDAETAEIAVQAALTGHLVFTTVHANNVFDVVGRFLHMAVDLYSFMSALNGVVAQRLVRLSCNHCARALSDAERRAYGWPAAIDPMSPALRRGVGCEACRGTGYRGRTVVGEALLIDDALRALVVRRADIRDVKAHAQQQGSVSLESRALELVREGRTTLDEIDRVITLE